MADHEYFKWRYDSIDGAASLGALQGVKLEQLRAIKTGQPAAQLLPQDLSFQMRDSHPKDVMLIDYVSNVDTLLLISPRLQAFLLEEAIVELEMLPVSILDHRGRVAASDYKIAHPTRVVDCVDQKKSKFKWNPLDPQNMAPVSRLVLDPAKLVPDDRLIRPLYIVNEILVRDDLAERLLDQNFDGPYMLPVEE